MVRNTLKYNSFRWRSIRMFNRLPKAICMLSSCSVVGFKSQLDSHLRNIVDLPCRPGFNNSGEGSNDPTRGGTVCCCCLPTPMTLASGGSPMFPLVVHQPASPSIWPAVQSLRRGLSTNPGATMWCVCGCS